MFRGQYFHTIDPKGRITFPSKLRDIFAEKHESRMVITKWEDYLMVFPYEEWNILEEKMRHQSIFDKKTREFQRFHMSDADDCTLDSQGRVLIPPSLRQYAGLQKDIVIAGMVRTLEIWSRERWDKEIEKIKFQDFSEHISKLGI